MAAGRRSDGGTASRRLVHDGKHLGRPPRRGGGGERPPAGSTNGAHDGRRGRRGPAARSGRGPVIARLPFRPVSATMHDSAATAASARPGRPARRSLPAPYPAPNRPRANRVALVGEWPRAGALAMSARPGATGPSTASDTGGEENRAPEEGGERGGVGGGGGGGGGGFPSEKQEAASRRGEGGGGDNRGGGRPGRMRHADGIERILALAEIEPSPRRATG